MDVVYLNSKAFIKLASNQIKLLAKSSKMIPLNACAGERKYNQHHKTQLHIENDIEELLKSQIH